MMFLALLLIVCSVSLLLFVLESWFRPGYYRAKIRQWLSRKRTKKSPNRFSKMSDVKSEAMSNLSRQKGLKFEEYVTTLLPKQEGFQLLEWRGDKYINGVYALSTQYPDLEYCFKGNNFHYRFAIECKWRTAFVYERIQVCQEHQLKNYRQFAVDKRIPVFIVLGVGGKPNAPAELFVIPLSDLSSVIVTRKEILHFQKVRINESFYVNQNRLTYR